MVLVLSNIAHVYCRRLFLGLFNVWKSGNVLCRYWIKQWACGGGGLHQQEQTRFDAHRVYYYGAYCITIAANERLVVYALIDKKVPGFVENER